VKRFLDAEKLFEVDVGDYLEENTKKRLEMEEAQRAKSVGSEKVEVGGKINGEIYESSLIRRRASVGNPFIGSLGGIKSGFKIDVKPCVVNEKIVEESSPEGEKKEMV